MYSIQSSPIRHLTNLTYLGIKLKKTLAITREAFSGFYVPQYFKQTIKKSFIALKVSIQYFHIFVLHTISSSSWHTL